MTARDDEPVLEQLADLLPPYDDALREGTPPPTTDLPPSSPELPARLRRAQACLRLLRGRWPGRQTDGASDVTATDSPLSDLASPGARLGRFAIVRLLGHGVVYLARDPALRREVALKVARPETFLDADLHGRFRREAAAAAGLDHPNLVPVHELGEVGHAQDIRVVAFSPDGRFLASAAKSVKQPVGELKIWDLPAGQEAAARSGQGNCLAFSRDGRLLAFRDDDSAVQLLDLSTLKSTHRIPDPAPVCCVALAPDGNTLATADTEGLVKLWDVRTGTEKERRGAHAGQEVRALVFSPDGKTLASAGMDKTIVLWQAATGLELLRLKNLPDYAHALAFSADSALLAAACHDGTIRVYQGTAAAE